MAERNWNDYVNADGLRQRYGTGEAEVTRGGELPYASANHIIEIELLATDLKAHDDATDPTTVLDWNTRVPTGVVIEKAELEVITAFAGATATLDIGLVKASDQEAAFTDLDDDGIDAAIAVTAIDAAGDTIACDGALVGTTLASDDGGYLVSAEAGTATFTAGEARLRIYYFVP